LERFGHAFYSELPIDGLDWCGVEIAHHITSPLLSESDQAIPVVVVGCTVFERQLGQKVEIARREHDIDAPRSQSERYLRSADHTSAMNGFGGDKTRFYQLMKMYADGTVMEWEEPAQFFDRNGGIRLSYATVHLETGGIRQGFGHF